jgi:small-conductance mechanosensitive channel
MAVAAAGIIGFGALATLPRRACSQDTALARRDTLTDVAPDSLGPVRTRLDSTAIGRAAAALSVEAESATPETITVEPQVSVPVFLGGKEVFRVRAGRDGLTPRDRAAAIRARLTAAVQKRSLPADSVRLVSTPMGIEVRLDDQFLWLITPPDIEDTDPASVAAAVAELPGRIREGIVKEREGRRPVSVLISILVAIGITIATLVLVRLLIGLSMRWRSWLGSILVRHVPKLRVRGFEVLSQAQLSALVRGVLGRLDVVAYALLFYVYVTLVLSLFPWTQGWSWLLFNIASRALMDMARGLGAAVPGLFIIVVILVVFRWLVAVSDRFFDGVASGTLAIGGFHPELAMPSKRLARIMLWIVAVMVAYPYIPGSQSRAVQGVSLLIGVMISIGSSGFVGNIIAGILLTYARSFRVGDRVRFGDHVGDVTNLGFFATKIRTIRNEELTLPNGLVASGSITNFTRLAEEHGLNLHTEVTIGYDVDWRTVHALLAEAALRVQGVEKEPAPWVYQRSLNDYHVTYELNAVTRLSHDQPRLYSDLHQEIQDAFARAGVEILSPAFQALRDANRPILPKEPSGPRGRPSGFRVLPPES